MLAEFLSQIAIEPRNLIWIIPVTIIILLLTGAVQAAFLPQASSLPKTILVFGVQAGQWFLPKTRARWRNTLRLKENLVSMYKSHNESTTVLSVLALGDLVFLPTREIQWLADQPDSTVSAHELFADFLETDHTIPGSKLVQDNLHVHLIATKLTRETGNLIPILHDETKRSVDELWGVDETEWKEIDALSTLQRVIAQVNGRIFFGAPLCRNKRLQALSLAFTQDVPLSALLLRLTWKPLRAILAPILTIPNRIHLAQFYAILKPEITRRLSIFDNSDQKNDVVNLPEEVPKNDFLQWAISQARSQPDLQHATPYALARRLLIVNFASIHTSSLVVSDALVDLSKNVLHINSLQQEISSVLGRYSGQFNKSAVAEMYNLDSAIRESQRLSNGNFVTVARKVVHRDGIVTPSGLHLPYGTIVGVLGYALHHDDRIYPDPEAYHPFRFTPPICPPNTEERPLDPQREETSSASVSAKTRLSWVTTSPEYTPFGHGRYACPGRFFASTSLKILIAYLISHYDIQVLANPPQSLWRVASQVAGAKLRFRVRRRKDSGGGVA